MVFEMVFLETEQIFEEQQLAVNQQRSTGGEQLKETHCSMAVNNRSCYCGVLETGGRGEVRETVWYHCRRPQYRLIFVERYSRVSNFACDGTRKFYWGFAFAGVLKSG